MLSPKAQVTPVGRQPERERFSSRPAASGSAVNERRKCKRSDFSGSEPTFVPAAANFRSPEGSPVCGIVKRVSSLSVRGMVLCEVTGTAPHDGFRRWIVSNVFRRDMRFSPRPHPSKRDRLTSVPLGPGSPPRRAGIQIRLWPPLSSDSLFRSSTASASEPRSCGPWQRRPCETRVWRPVVRPNFSKARNAELE